MPTSDEIPYGALGPAATSSEPSNVRPVQFVGPDGPLPVTGNELVERLLVAELQTLRISLDQIETRLSALEARANQQERRG